MACIILLLFFQIKYIVTMSITIVDNVEIRQIIYGNNLVNKVQVDAATTSSNTLSNFVSGLVVDGHTLADGDRLLVKDQISNIENGVYDISSGLPVRSVDFHIGLRVSGAQVPIINGTINTGTIWICNNGIVNSIVGTDGLTFVKSTIVAGSLGVDQGGTGVTNIPVDTFLIGNGTAPIDTSKTVPAGDIVGTSDPQTLSNKTLDTANTTFQNGINALEQMTFDLSALTAPVIMGAPSVSGPIATEQYVDDELKVLSDPIPAALGFANLIKAEFLTNERQIALTTQVLMATTTGFAKWGSCDDGNIVNVYANGIDFANNTILQRFDMDKGSVASLGGLSNGAIISSTKGISGVGMNAATTQTSTTGADSGLMPFGCEAFASSEFFFFAFRNSSGGVGEVGIIYVAGGSVESTVELQRSDGTTVDGPVTLNAFELVEFKTDANTEFKVVSNRPVIVTVGARIEDISNNSYYDLRLVPPLDTDVLTHVRGCRVSALNTSTVVKAYMRDGVLGRFTVSPGSPLDVTTGVINELGDVFEIRSNAVAATGGNFTITVNGETTGNISFNATSRQVATALDGLTSYSSVDFDVYMTVRDRLGENEAIMRIECIGALSRIVGTPSINTGGLTGNVHTLVLIQAGNVADNLGNDADYAPDGMVRFISSLPISVFSGNDFEATYAFPTRAVYQRVPLFLRHVSNDTSVNINGMTFISPYEGVVKVYNSDGSIYNTVSMTRTVTVTSCFDQNHPAGASFAPDNSVLGIFEGGYAESNVPFMCIHNPNNELEFGSLPVDEVRMHGEEVVLLGITPEKIRAEFITDGKRILRKRVIDDNGIESWVIA